MSEVPFAASAQPFGGVLVSRTDQARTDAYGGHTSIDSGDVVHLNSTGKGHVLMTGGSGRGAGLGQALRVPEFRALWAAELVSVAGDQLARVGLSVLVFGRTGSAAWALSLIHI